MGFLYYFCITIYNTKGNMKTISLNVPDGVFEKLEKYRKAENMNRTSYVMEAVVEYNRKLEREELRKKLHEEIELDREVDKEIIEEWDVTIGDNLDDEDHGF